MDFVQRQENLWDRRKGKMVAVAQWLIMTEPECCKAIGSKWWNEETEATLGPNRSQSALGARWKKDFQDDWDKNGTLRPDSQVFFMPSLIPCLLWIVDIADWWGQRIREQRFTRSAQRGTTQLESSPGVRNTYGTSAKCHWMTLQKTRVYLSV